MKIFFFTLGCKVNQYETTLLKNIFISKNFEVTENIQEANIFIINSCTVTATSDKKVNKLINKIKNVNRNAIVALTGCLPQAFPEKMEYVKNVDIITGNTNKLKLPELLEEFIKNKTRNIYVEAHKKNVNFDNTIIKKVFKTPRAFIKIQDGCDRFCTYCIIPKARGFITSKPLNILKQEVQNVCENGCCEVVLTGINLSCYGKDFENINIIDAIKTVLSVKGVERLRLSSLEPNLLKKDDILFLSKEERFCPQFHFSLQSGCNSVLKRMGRHYNKNEYIENVKFIFKHFSNPSITTDIIVGFPGETNQEFEESLHFVERIGFSRVHIFPYSKRPGTKAANMPNQIPSEIKKERAKIMSNAAKKSTEKFLKNQQNKILQVLFETNSEGIYKGYSKNYCLVKVKFNSNICGKIKNVKITNFEKQYLIGTIID